MMSRAAGSGCGPPTGKRAGFPTKRWNSYSEVPFFWWTLSLLTGSYLCHSPGMTVFDDLEAEQDRLERILADLDLGQWTSASGAAGWTVADVVLHLAQSEEAVTACVEHPDLRAAAGGRPASTVEEHAAEMVRAERPEVFSPSPVFGRWMRARRRALDALRGADQQLSIEWVAGPVKA